MPNVMPSDHKSRRMGRRLLLLCMAIAVSYLFSVLPFGNTRIGFMPPAPGPVWGTASALSASISPPHLSDELSWDGDCQVVWAAVNDATPVPGLWAALGAPPITLVPSDSGIRRAWNHRPPPCCARFPYHLRAPPRLV